MHSLDAWLLRNFAQQSTMVWTLQSGSEKITIRWVMGRRAISSVCLDGKFAVMVAF